jgi:uncharacterized protein
MPIINAERRLILFGRYPVPGTTKSRLIPLLGPLGAAEIQRQWTEGAVSTLERACLAPMDFAYTDGTPEQMRRWLGKTNIRCFPQTAGDLGTRMQAAIEDAFGQGVQQVVLLGTDVPQMTPRHLVMAFDALADYDLVLGPVEDGGYWLVGCCRPVSIFQGIAWGTPAVLEQTRSLATRQGVSLFLLPKLKDLDTESDLRAWRPGYPWATKPYLSVVIPALNEAANIVRTIEPLRATDVETIVVDGGSQDQTRQLARQAGAKVIETVRGRAWQQNEGARLAQGQVLLFLHADTRLPSGFGAQIFEVLMDPDTVLGAFRFKTDWDHWAMRCMEHAVHFRAAYLRLPYGDQGLFMRRGMFEQVGGFAQVPIAEDLFLVRRLAFLGGIALAPGAAVTSGRRWRHSGIVRTTLINYMIALGCLAGVDPKRLAPLYNRAGPKLSTSKDA